MDLRLMTSVAGTMNRLQLRKEASQDKQARGGGWFPLDLPENYSGAVL